MRRARDGPSWGWSGVRRASLNRTQALPEEGQRPLGMSLTGGSTLDNWSGPYRRTEVVTMAAVAILIAVGVVALIYLGLFFVVFGGLLAMLAVDKTERTRWRGVH